MSNFDQEQNFEPDLGDPEPLTSAPKRGIRARAERSFIQMVQAAFLGNDEFPYSPEEGEGRLYVRSVVSNENQAFLPRVEVKIGPLSEYDGAVDNLKEWSKPVRRHVYVDQAQVIFVCTAEEQAESSDLGERVRRVLDMAKKDLGKRGLFGMQTSELTAPQAARPATEEDDVYQSVVKAPFMLIERHERHEDTSDPFGSGTGSTYEYVDESRAIEESGEVEPFKETEEEEKSPKDIAVQSAVADSSTSGVDITLTFERPIGTHQVSGLTATVGPETVDPYAVRDSAKPSEVTVETGVSFPAGTPSTISYSPGNLKDADGHPATAFGPVDVTWA